VYDQDHADLRDTVAATCPDAVLEGEVVMTTRPDESRAAGARAR
jgi:hypothetical protein